MNLLPARPIARRGFTLLELLVSAVLLMVVAALTLSILNSTTSLWNRHKAGVAAYGDSRVIVETVANRIAQATLNPYWDYDDRAAPQRYMRRSELHFKLGPVDGLLPSVSNTSGSAVFFSAPIGFSSDGSRDELVKMLSACGFYVRFGPEENRPPFLAGRVPERYRYRLYQVLQPGEELAVYADVIDPDTWYRSAASRWSFPLAENVIGIIIRAKYPSGSGEVVSYQYDSRATSTPPPVTLHQLPPVLSITMVMMDEASAVRLADAYGDQPPPILPEAGTFQEIANFESDLSAWEGELRALNIQYKIFSAEVYIRGAKWSSM